MLDPHIHPWVLDLILVTNVIDLIRAAETESQLLMLKLMKSLLMEPQLELGKKFKYNCTV